MNEKEKQALVSEIRELLQRKIKIKSEFEFYEICEEVLSDSLEFVTMRLGELRESHDWGGD